MNLNNIPHIVWTVVVLLLLLVFYAVLALTDRPPTWVEKAIGAVVVAAIALARTDLPPGSGD